MKKRPAAPVAKSAKKPKNKADTHLLSGSDEANYQMALLRDETERGCALIGGAMVDDALGDLFHAVFNDTVEAWSTLLYGAGAPLGSLGARAQVAVRLGLIPQHDFDSIDLVRKIRNKAAHVIGTKENPFSFASPEIAAMTKKLDRFPRASDAVNKEAMTANRSRFFFMSAIVGQTLPLLDRAQKLREGRTIANRGAILGALIDQVAALPKPTLKTLWSWSASKDGSDQRSTNW